MKMKLIVGLPMPIKYHRSLVVWRSSNDVGGVARRSSRVDNDLMAERAKLVGFNHVALEVGDIEEALEFYGRLFEIELRGRGPRMAFIDAGDQFIALAEGENSAPLPTDTGTSGWWWMTGGWSGGP